MVYVRRNVKPKMSMKIKMKENVNLVTNLVVNVMAKNQIIVLNVAKELIYTTKNVLNLAQKDITLMLKKQHVKNVTKIVKHVQLPVMINVHLVKNQDTSMITNVLKNVQMNIIQKLKKMETEFARNVM